MDGDTITPAERYRRRLAELQAELDREGCPPPWPDPVPVKGLSPEEIEALVAAQGEACRRYAGRQFHAAPGRRLRVAR